MIDTDAGLVNRKDEVNSIDGMEKETEDLRKVKDEETLNTKSKFYSIELRADNYD